jgi:hypothetical protein
MGAALPGCVIEFWIGAGLGAVVNAAIVGQPWSDHDNPTRNFIACETLVYAHARVIEILAGTESERLFCTDAPPLEVRTGPARCRAVCSADVRSP